MDPNGKKEGRHEGLPFLRYNTYKDYHLMIFHCLSKDHCTLNMELLPNIGSERVTKLTEHGQGTVKNNQHADSPKELPQKLTPVFTIHRSTFGTLYDILLIGSRNLIEKPAAKQHNRVYQQTGGKSHEAEK